MLLFITLNIFDLILTLIGLQLGLLEGNIIYQFLFSSNLVVAIVIKLSLTFIIALLVQRFKIKLFKPLNIAFAIIVAWNLGGILCQTF